MEGRKRLAALALAAAILLACAPGALAAQQGTLTEGMTWTLGDEGVLVISGSGDMPDYAKEEDVPWYGCREQILWIMLDGEITRIGRNAFANCVNATHVTFPDTVKSIGKRAFFKCTALATSKSVKVTEDGAECLPGDVNRDGAVDGRDVVRLMKWLADETNESTGMPFDIAEKNADVNADGEVNELDLLRLVRYMGGDQVTLEEGKVQ